MKLLFDDIKLGGLPYTLKTSEGLSGDYEANSQRVPNQDNFINLPGFESQKIITFKGSIIANGLLEAKELRQNLKSKLGKNYLFTITDSVRDSGNVNYSNSEYEFYAKVIGCTPDLNRKVNYSEYELVIAMEDPNFYIVPEISVTANINTSGFGFDVGFPLVFTGTDNVLTIINKGGADIYPSFILTGAGTNFTIKNENSNLENAVLTINTTIISGDTITIDPNLSNAVKILDSNNESLVQFTNSNFESLRCTEAVTRFIINAESGIDANTSITARYRSADRVI